MKNKILEREINQNQSENEIFVHQSASDIELALQYIEQNYPNDICIRFSSFVWGNLSQLLKNYPYHHQQIWQQYIAEQIDVQLERKYNNMKASAFPFGSQSLSSDISIYALQMQAFYSYQNTVAILLRECNPFISRLHFMMNGLNDDEICKAVGTYLRSDIPQATMIYTNAGIYLGEEESDNLFWKQYDYLLFDEYQEGKPSEYRKMKEKGNEKTKIKEKSYL